MEEISPRSKNMRWMVLGIIVTIGAGAAIVSASWNARDTDRTPEQNTAVQQVPKVSEPAPQPEPHVSVYGKDDEIPPGATAIDISDNAYTPNTLTIAKGTTVYFVNKGTNEHWPASAVHPTHTVYPDSDISKCGTSEAATMFDACRGLKQGEFWAFTFNEVGSWRFHDHLVPKLNGTITVQ